MANFAKLDGRRVKIVNSLGGEVRSWEPYSGAVFVDTNPSNGHVAVTTGNGSVIVYNENGGQIVSFSHGNNITSARYNGNDLVVTHSNGNTELRTETGGWIRNF